MQALRLFWESCKNAARGIASMHRCQDCNVLHPAVGDSEWNRKYNQRFRLKDCTCSTCGVLHGA